MTVLSPESRERPVIFSGPMVRAILAGRKTQTRRVLKLQPIPFAVDDKGTLCDVGLLHVEGEAVPRVTLGRVVTMQKVVFAVGDRLWVKEATRRAPHLWVYDADGAEVPWPGRQAMATWTRDTGAAMYLPRAASRLTLIVERVRVERLQDISCADAIAEGIAPAANSVTIDCDTPDPREDYRSLWNSIHGKDAWDENPWVAAISFRPLVSAPLPTGQGEVV